MPLIALAIPVCVLFAICICILVFRPEEHRRNFALGVSIAALLVVEASLNYIGPSFYWLNHLAGDDRNPYSGAPFVAVLQRASREGQRIFSRDQLLIPDWASAFQIFDIRGLDALNYNKYLAFLRAFAAPSTAGADVGDRFTGFSNDDFPTPLQERLFQLSSVSRIGTAVPLGDQNPIVLQMLAQNGTSVKPWFEYALSHRVIAMGGRPRDVVAEHPPYTRLPYTLTVGKARPEVLHFSYGLDPEVFNKPGDGVTFAVEVKDERGNIKQLFSSYIDPKHDPSKRHWMDASVDLTAYAGRTVQLLFSTGPGPRGNTEFDWAAWSNFYFNDLKPQPNLALKLIYHGEANVYSYDDVLPRAAIFHHAEIHKNEAFILQRLIDPSLDIFRTVLLDVTKLSPGQADAVARINTQPIVRAESARITSYSSQAVSIDTALNTNGILVLNDSDYPGWTAEIDGRPAKWFTANYLFRGLLLPAGRHTVRFAYKSRAYREGAAVTLAGILGMVLALVYKPRSRTAQPFAEPEVAHNAV